MAVKKTPNIDFMMSYVKDYLDGKIKRWEYDLDFNHHLITRYAKMEREHFEFAEAFSYFISECGIDCGDDLSDVDFMDLIRLNYVELLAVAKDGFL
jgi:hypothetical protein